MSIGVIGAGAFGTSLAISLGQVRSVILWGRDENAMRDMNQSRTNARRLPDARFPEALSATNDLTATTSGDIVLLAVPMQTLASFVEEYADILSGKALVACCKGISLETGEGPVAILNRLIPDAQTAVLTGPSFAADIARGLPTALTLACADPATGQSLQTALTTPNLRLYRTTDVTGAELGGALKNVIAIASGVAIGAGFGDSARAALMTRGFAEMTRLAAALGALPETLAGLSGFGDLALTCTSEQSRNFQFGLTLGRGENWTRDTTVEGAATARAVLALAARNKVDLPITKAVVAIQDGALDVQEVLSQLLSRPLKEE